MRLPLQSDSPLSVELHELLQSSLFSTGILGVNPKDMLRAAWFSRATCSFRWRWWLSWDCRKEINSGLNTRFRQVW